jgi:LPS-assembly protein
MIFQLLFYAAMSFAQSTADGVAIRNADSMYSDSKIVKLEGHVQMVFQGQSLSCDSATINMKTQTLIAEGHVIVEGMKIHFEGSRIQFNYKSNTGIIYDGFVQSGQVIFQGSTIEKTGEMTFIAQNAEFTACDTCPPGWAFSGRTIEAEIGGYAYIKRPVFKVAGVPIFIFPAMTVPLKSTRQSGFLVPGLDFSSIGGAAVMDSFFWAIDKSHDLTLTAVQYEKRGLKGHEEYRFMTSETSKGDLSSAYLNDRALKNTYNLSSNVDRWFVHYRHYFDMPDDFISRADIQPVSDLRYPRDFPNELAGSGDPSLESKISLTKNWEMTHLSAGATMNQNLLQFYPLSDNSDAVHKMPQIEFDGRERRVMGPNGPLVKWNATYVNFARNGYGYDDLIQDPKHTTVNGTPYLTGNLPTGFNSVVRDGHFDPPTDKLRTGQRVDVQPSLAYPFQLWHNFDILPRATFRETDYQFDLPSGAEANGFSPTASRRYVQTDVTAKTEFSTVFGNADEKATRWKHSLLPELSYSEIPWLRKPEHPFFGDYSGLPYYRQWYPMSDADIVGANGLQFDYDDRVYDRKLTTFALTQALVRKRWTNGEAIYQRVGMLRVSQSYDFAQEHTIYSQPWGPVDGLLQVKMDNFETYTAAQWNEYANATNVSSTLKAKINEKNYLLFSYALTWLFDEANAIVPNSKTEDYGAGLGFTSRYFDVGGKVDYSTTAKPNQWIIQSFDVFTVLRPPGNCWHFKINGHQDLGGETSWRVNFAFDFSGGQGDTTNSSNSTRI